MLSELSIFEYPINAIMEIVLDHEQKPQGVFLPLKEWEHLRHVINRASDLYKLMDELTQKDVFDMDADEFAAHLLPVAENAARQSLEQGLYFSYPSRLEGEPATFIHEYQNGRKVLVKVDNQTGKEQFLKNL